MAYILLCLKHQRPNLYATLKKAHLLNWDLYLNLGDILFVVAERKYPRLDRRIGAQAGVISDVPPRSEMIGSPAQPVKTFFKEVATVRRWVRNGGIPAQTGTRTKTNPDVD